MKRRYLQLIAYSAVGLCFSSGSSAWAAGWPMKTNHEANKVGTVLASPLIANIDASADGALEIVVPAFDDWLYVWNHTGVERDGWPRRIYSETQSNSTKGDGTMASACAADLDNDGKLEVVVFCDKLDGSDGWIRAYWDSGSPSMKELTISSVSGKETAKCTPVAINCMQFDSSSSHPGQEILLRDGNGIVRVFTYRGGNLSDVTAVGTLDTLPNSGDDPFGDLYGTHLIGPSVSVKDLGGNDTLLVAPSTNGKVYVWKLSSSTSSNLSKTVIAGSGSAPAIAAGGPIFGSAALADLDGDNEVDCIVGATDGKVYIWEVFGNNVGGARSGWPKEAEVDVNSTATPAAIVSSPAVSFLGNDGSGHPQYLIAIGSNDRHVYLWKTTASGDTREHVLETSGDVSSSPILADVDGSAGNGPEVFATSLDGRLYAWYSSTGGALDGWPKRLGSQAFSSPAVADIHHCGRMSVIAASLDGWIYCFDLAPLYDTGVSSWPQFRGNQRRSGLAP